MPLSTLSRRELLIKSSTLSVAGFGLLAGISTRALAAGEGGKTTAEDIDVLNLILGTEHEGIAAYQICMDQKLLKDGAAKNAVLFQGHHKKHRDLLIGIITQLGGTPAESKTDAAYASDLDTAKLKSEKETLHMIIGLELGAANAYIGMLPSTNDRELIKTASRIAADEVIHWTTWSSFLRMPLPTQALSFGA